jgi:methylmalonyl-CoA mutase C-terminal domain/subunit
MKYKTLIGILGMDQHEVGAISVARMLRDAGIEVVYVGRFNTPSTILRSAIAEDVDVIGLSCHSWEYLEFIPELIELTKKEAVNIGVIAGGSVITPGDTQVLLDRGVDAVFGPDATADAIIEGVLKICEQRRQAQ